LVKVPDMIDPGGKIEFGDLRECLKGLFVKVWAGYREAQGVLRTG